MGRAGPYPGATRQYGGNHMAMTKKNAKKVLKKAAKKTAAKKAQK